MAWPTGDDPKYRYEKTCAVCGKSYLTFSNRSIYCCEECRRRGATQKRQVRRHQGKTIVNGEQIGRTRHYDKIEQTKTTTKLVRKTAKEATDHGMSYGQWVAQQYMRRENNGESGRTEDIVDGG